MELNEILLELRRTSCVDPSKKARRNLIINHNNYTAIICKIILFDVLPISNYYLHPLDN